MEEYKMITQEQLAKMLNCSLCHVTFLRELGIIPAIKTGRNYMFSLKAVNKFYEDYEGLDVSNRVQAMISKDIVSSRRRTGKDRY